MSHYIMMETFLTRFNIKKALHIEHRDPDDLYSSCVDDVFYIIKSTLARILATREVNSFCTIVNMVVTTVEEDYVGWELRRMGIGNVNVNSAKEVRVKYMVKINK